MIVIFQENLIWHQILAKPPNKKVTFQNLVFQDYDVVIMTHQDHVTCHAAGITSVSWFSQMRQTLLKNVPQICKGRFRPVSTQLRVYRLLTY